MITRLKSFNHWPLGLILACFAGLAILYNVILPLAEVSDAQAHFALIRFIAEEGRPPLTLEERSAIGIKGDASPFYHGLVALLTAPIDVSGFPELPRISQKEERTLPGDPRIIQSIFHTEDEAFPYQGIALVWHVAGLLSIPMGMVTIVAIYLTVLAIYPRRRYLALTAAAFVAFLPRFLISSAVVNDDNLVFPLIALTLLLLVRLLQGQAQRRTFMLLGALIGLAALVKYHSLLLLLELTAIALFVAWREGWAWSTALRRWGWSLLFFGLTAGWWLGFILIRFNDIADLGLVAGLLAPFGDPVVTLGSTHLLSPEFNPISIAEYDYWLSWTFRSFWLHYNGLYTGMQAMGREAVYWLPFWVFGLLLLFSGLGLLRKGVLFLAAGLKEGGPVRQWRPEIILLGGHTLLYLGLMVMRYMLFPAWSTAQGRHLYPALTGIAFFVAVGLDEWRRALQQRFNSASLSRRGLAPASLPLGLGSGLLLLNLLVIPGLIIPVYYPFLPLRTQHPDDAPISHRLTREYGQEIRFEGYDLDADTTAAGSGVNLNLYWRSRAKQTQDYLMALCLQDSTGAPVACHYRQPVDGRYPVRAWEEGYLIRDEATVPTPACLPSGRYTVTLNLLPLAPEEIEPVIDAAAELAAPLSLTQVTVTAASPAERSFELWLAGQQSRAGQVTLWRQRQALTVVTYDSAGGAPAALRLEPAEAAAGTVSWLPVDRPGRYRCPDGTWVTSHSFILHPGVQPGLYRFAPQVPGLPLIEVHTPARTFTAPMDMETPGPANFGDQLDLLGYRIDLSPRFPGETVDLTTYWRARRTMSHNYVGSLRLLDPTLTMWSQDDHPLGSEYPTLLWAPGEIVESGYKLPLHDYVAAGQYVLKFGVYTQAEGRFDFLPVTGPTQPEPASELTLGLLRVKDPAGARGPGQPLQVDLAGQIRLLGYELTTAPRRLDEPLELALFWQALRPPDADYTVFTQLLGPDGQVWGQQDNQPQGGSFPTSSWTPQETVVDRYALTLAAGAPPGQYQLLLGMYALQTGQRLPAIDRQGQRLFNDAVVIGPLMYEEPR